MNNKIKIKNSAFMYPMPVVLVGAKVDGKANFMEVGWAMGANFSSPKVVMALNDFHYTNKGILSHREFSINIPSSDLVVETDYCGMVAGEKIDKSELFGVFYGELVNAPMIKECPISIECRLINTLELERDLLIIGEMVNTYTEDKYLSDGKPDVTKVKPFSLTMPDNNYWAIGEWLGKAWDIGNKLKK